jgi:predicted nucleic acid-binding protein
MILADTSIWIVHFRYGEPRLAHRLSEGLVLMHPCVSGELACGNLKDRRAILSDLQALPPAEVASYADIMALVEERKLWGRGLGWVDVHLLASSLLSECQLWTLDKQLKRAALEMGLA